MTNVHDQAARMRADADRIQRTEEFISGLPEDKRDAAREYFAKQDSEAAQSAPAAPEGPTHIPVPGMGDASGVASAPNPAIPGMGDAPGGRMMPSEKPNMAPKDPDARQRLAQERLRERAADPWSVDLDVDNVPGVADAERQAAYDALAAFEDFTEDHRDLLRADWYDVVTRREAEALAEYAEKGTQPPASRKSLVDAAMRDRPWVLARAAVLKRAVEQADQAAKSAFKRDAVEAAPRARDAVAASLDRLEAAVAEVSAASAEAERGYRTWNTLRHTVSRPLPTQREMDELVLVDPGAPLAALREELRRARSRIGAGQ